MQGDLPRSWRRPLMKLSMFGVNLKEEGFSEQYVTGLQRRFDEVEWKAAVLQEASNQ